MRRSRGAADRDLAVERPERADRVPAGAGAGLRLDAAGPPGRAGLAAGHHGRLRCWRSRTDSLDGYLARKHNIITRFGKLADPIADKALTGMAFIGLSILGELWWWVTIVILVREWGITVMRFVVLRYGVMAAGRGGKIKTVLQAVALILYLLPLPGWAEPVAMVVMAAAFVVTVVTGLDYVREAVQLRRQAAAARPS